MPWLFYSKMLKSNGITEMIVGVIVPQGHVGFSWWLVVEVAIAVLVIAAVILFGVPAIWQEVRKEKHG